MLKAERVIKAALMRAESDGETGRGDVAKRIAQQLDEADLLVEEEPAEGFEE